mgnify:CR=1 FL=1
MVENRPWLNFFTHLILILGVIVVVFPVYVAFVASTQTAVEVEQAPMSLLPGAHFIENYMQILTEGGGTASRAPVGRMLFVSLMMAMGISIGKILISLVSAFAIVYFRFPGRKLCFWLIFITLMLPVEVRISPTYEVMADLHLLDSWGGLILPVIASATATFLFRQFFLTVPDELTEAARMDGADAKALRETMDKVKDKLGTAVAVLAAVSAEGRVQLAAGVSRDLTDRVKAGELVNSVAQKLGGKGGGKPDMAMAGAQSAEGLDAALADVQAWVEAKL